jgi:acyl carrier protein
VAPCREELTSPRHGERYDAAGDIHASRVVSTRHGAKQEFALDRPIILSRIGDTLANILDQDHLDLAESTTADDVEDWDSVNHVKLMIALESEFGVRFETSEITAPANVGELISLIQSKL